MQRRFSEQKPAFNYHFNWYNYDCSKGFHFKPQMKILSNEEMIIEKLKNQLKTYGITIKNQVLNEMIIDGEIMIDLNIINQEINRITNNIISFDELTIRNRSIRAIQAKTFERISFKKISIEDEAMNLNEIHFEAFGFSSQSVTHLEIQNQLPTNQSPKNLIDLLNSFKNIRDIYITSPKIICGSFKLPQLAYLIIDGSFKSSAKLESIDDLAFFYCDKLRFIDLSYNKLNKINNNLFKFKNQLNEVSLTLKLNNNELTETSFESLSLLNFKRSVELILNHNQIKYLDEAVFRTFLDLDLNNKIDLNDNSYEVNNPKNWWLMDKKYEKRILGILAK